ncbi:MAG: glycosyltransferase [Acidimicrobiia bacterium]
MSVLGGLKSALARAGRRELVRFAVVGASGVLVNNLALYLLHGVAGWPLIVASPLAVETAIVSNFLGNDRWTFADRSKRPLRFLTFNLVSIGGLVVNTLVLNALVATTGLHYLLANLAGIGAALAWNFSANARWTWRSRERDIEQMHRLGVEAHEDMKGEIVATDLVVVPTYNEAANIERLVESVLAQGPYSVLIVDDGSPDGTGQIADRLSRRHAGSVGVVHRKVKSGLGAAYRAAFGHALATGADRVYQMDADFSHDPRRLPKMRRAMLEGSDLVIGSRYAEGGGVVGWPWWRKVLSRGGSVYAGAILALPHRDLTGGFKGWRRETLQAIRPETTRSNGYAFQIETTYRAHRAGAGIEEIPIRFRDRERGVSKMGVPIILEAVKVVPGLRFRRPEVTTLHRRRQLRTRGP